jgi:hypothetical protein
MARVRAGAPAIGAGYGHSSFAETFPQTVGLTPAVCTGGRCGTLYVLLGDSIDREVARSRCTDAVQYDTRRCHKCLLCPNDGHGNTWLNIMTYGVGVGGVKCNHSDSGWAEAGAEHDIHRRTHTLLGTVLHSAAARSYGSIVVQLHSGAWDVLSTKECPHVAPMLMDGSAWAARAQSALIDTARSVVRSAPVAAAVQQLRWRTLPFQCKSLAGERKREDVSALFAAVAAHGARLACKAWHSIAWHGIA